MKRLLITIILMSGIWSTAQAQFPAPMCKQLKIASLCYYAPWWTPNNIIGYVPSMRDWAANRYSMLITTGGTSTSVSYMKSINPQLKVLQYSLFGRHTTDTASLRALAVANGLNFTDCILHTATADVTTHMPTGGSGYGTYQDVTTTADNSPIIFSYWINTQRRVSLDPRNWQSGALLWDKIRTELDNGAGTSDDLDGVMLDEEQRWTGLFPGEGPILPTAGDTWATQITHPFTGISDAAFPDSQKSWRANWAKILGDSARANGKIIAPNGTTGWGFHTGQADSGWKVEGRHAIVNYGGGFINEFAGSYMCGSTGSGFQQAQVNLFKFQIQMAYQLRDSAVNLILAYISVGPPNWSCAGWSRPRDAMMFLGLCALSTFPTTNGSTVYFSPKWTASYNDVYHNRGTAINYSCQTVNYASDTIWEWDGTWGKYLGVPTLSIDSSQITTDGAGQQAKIFKKTFNNPSTGNPLTFVAMRFPSGGNWTPAATNVNVTLPTGTWYELLSNKGDSAGRGNEDAFWRPTSMAGGSTFTLANGQARVFSQNTALSDAGLQDSSISIANASIVTEGGQLAFTVTRSWNIGSVQINYSTADGPAPNGATAPGDYVPQTPGQLTIPDGSYTGTIFVATNTDAIQEPTEVVLIHLNSATVGTIITADAQGQIADGTTPPSPSNEKKLKLKKE